MALAVALVGASAAEDPADPWMDRIEPLGGQVATTVDVTLMGRNLELPAALEFDSPHLAWQPGGVDSSGNITGRIQIAEETPLGPHIATLMTPRGRSNSRMFYVDEFASSFEAEPNDTIGNAQPIRLRPQTIQGGMHQLSDIDTYRFEARAGQRWTFDLRSLEYGGFLENDMSLLDSDGVRVAFSDDRDDYLETPFIEHTFDSSGTYYLKLDQYRGPQRVNCNRNCGYMLRIGNLPVVQAAFPLGAAAGGQIKLSLRGRWLQDVERIWLAPVRRAEYYRLTFPYTIPVRVADTSFQRLDAEVQERTADRVTAKLTIPRNAPRGLWRIWTESPGGSSDSVSFVVSDMAEPDCGAPITPSSQGVACNGVLQGQQEEHEYWLDLRANRPVVVTTLAAQLGLPYIDTVLELFDSEGALVAEHDDLMSGQGTVIGNPDSMLYFKSASGGRYRLLVRDRIDRGGPDMAYRLRIEEREPGFALLADPENLNVQAGSTERIDVLLVPEPGFGHAVDVWIEAPPPGVSGALGQFRADQYFGPSGDGDNVVIPTAFLDVTVASDLAVGDYPLRILGRASGRENTVRALSTLWIGPPRKRNDIRRPLESIRLTVLDRPAEAMDTPAGALSDGSGGAGP
jgi:hypothetical protein